MGPTVMGRCKSSLALVYYYTTIHVVYVRSMIVQIYLCSGLLRFTTGITQTLMRTQ